MFSCLWKLYIVNFITAVLDFSQPVPVDIPYDYRPPASGPKSYSRPVVTINKGEGQGVSSFIGNSVCPMLLFAPVTLISELGNIVLALEVNCCTMKVFSCASTISIAWFVDVCICMACQ